MSAELRKEWKELVDVYVAGSCQCAHCAGPNKSAYVLALRLQELADKERREAFEAGHLRSYEPHGCPDTFVFSSYAAYLKSKEGK